MFDDGNRMPDMMKKCERFLLDRPAGLLHADDVPSPEAIEDCTRGAVEDFWLLHTGERARWIGTDTEEYNPREEG